MMDLLPPVARGDIGTKRNLQTEVGGLRSEMQAGFAELRSEMQAAHSELLLNLFFGLVASNATLEDRRVPRHGSVGVPGASTPRFLQRCRIVRRGVVVHSELAGILRHLIERGPAFASLPSLEVDQVLKADATVAIRLLERNGAVFEELHESRPADAEQVRRLLGREQHALRGNEGGLSLPHDVDDLSQHPVHLGWQRDLLAVGAEEQPGFCVLVDEARQLEQLVEILGWEDEVILAVPMLSGGVGHVPIVCAIRKSRKHRSSGSRCEHQLVADVERRGVDGPAVPGVERSHRLPGSLRCTPPTQRCW